MTKREFIKILEEERYSYKIWENKVIVTHKGDINLSGLTSIPPDVEFKNEGGVWLDSLTSLPPDVEFNNWEDVILKSLTSLPPEVEFNNGGSTYLKSLMGSWFYRWKGNIEGIGNKRLLNKMISIGLFER